MSWTVQIRKKTPGAVTKTEADARLPKSAHSTRIRAAIALVGLAGLVLFQAWAYWARLPLSLGPRVILQPWLLSRGLVMYDNIGDLHTPLMPQFLSLLVPLFPNGFELARTVDVILVSLITVLTFFAARRLTGWLGAVWAAWFFTAWSPILDFSKLWHEVFLTVLYLAWLLVEGNGTKQRRPAVSIAFGFLAGVSALIKQQAGVAFLLFAAWRVFAGRSRREAGSGVWREIGFICLGAALPLAALLVHQVIRAGSLHELWYWTVAYHLSSEYTEMASQRPTLEQVGIIASALLLVPAAAMMAVQAKRRGHPSTRTFGILLVAVTAGTLTVFPRFEFYHLQPALPALAVLSAFTLSQVLHLHAIRQFAAGTVFGLTLFWAVTTVVPAYRPVVRPQRERLIWEYSNLVPLSEQIRRHIGKAGTFYVFPDYEATSNLYYLLNSEPPPFWIFHYPWFLSGPIRTRILTSLDTFRPEWIVIFPHRIEALQQARDIQAYIDARYRYETRFSWIWGDVLLLRRIRGAAGEEPETQPASGPGAGTPDGVG
jgi:hypothetical protein